MWTLAAEKIFADPSSHSRSGVSLKALRIKAFSEPSGLVRQRRDQYGSTSVHKVLRCHLNARLYVCTMASDHCGLLWTPHG